MTYLNLETDKTQLEAIIDVARFTGNGSEFGSFQAIVELDSHKQKLVWIDYENGDVEIPVTKDIRSSLEIEGGWKPVDEEAFNAIEDLAAGKTIAEAYAGLEVVAQIPLAYSKCEQCGGETEYLNFVITDGKGRISIDTNCARTLFLHDFDSLIELFAWVALNEDWKKAETEISKLKNMIDQDTILGIKQIVI